MALAMVGKVVLVDAAYFMLFSCDFFYISFEETVSFSLILTKARQDGRTDPRIGRDKQPHLECGNNQLSSSLPENSKQNRFFAIWNKKRNQQYMGLFGDFPT